MKKEHEEIKNNQHPEAPEKNGLSKLISENKGVVKALGIASFLAIAGYTATQLLKDKKLMKKIKNGIKTPKALKYVENMLSIDALKDSKVVKAVKDIKPKDIKKVAKKEIRERISAAGTSKEAASKAKRSPRKKKAAALDEFKPGRKKQK